jgi:hypothetical protein
MAGPGITTLQTMVTSIRSRTDTVATQFITDTEIYGYINSSIQELYDMLIEAYGADYYVATPSQFTTDGVNQLFVLPSDFYKLLGVDIAINGATAGPWLTLKPFNFAERNRFYPYATQPLTGVGTSPLRYRLAGGKLWLTPTPTAGQLVQLWYAPRFTPLLVNPTDTFDGINGWEEYVVVDCCIKVFQKEESDPSVFVSQKADLKRRIDDIKGNRDIGFPSTVVDSQGAENPWRSGFTGGSGYGYGGGSGW